MVFNANMELFDMTKPDTNIRALGTDQVIWLEDTLNRFAATAKAASSYPGISRSYQAARVAAILEIMEILGLELQPESGAHSNLYRNIQPSTGGQSA